ncbi:MAG: hypothetical protein Q8P38_12075 [Candidatus Nanopelagicales bacterium]|nr:hypothetical protein [Candidatus Nanopelagicales bacterium]
MNALGGRGKAGWAEPDPRYVAARRVLLDALTALAPHGNAIIVAGAQAVYLRTGVSDIAIAPYTTDGDLTLDPTLLGDEPELEVSMRGAGFELMGQESPQPGVWVASVDVAGEQLVIPVDLIVPEAAATGGGRRGARLGIHGNRAARRAVGLEAALVDHSPITVAALDAEDPRALDVEVAGVAALLVAKAHKIHDRVLSKRPDRLSDKDAADVYRIMQTASSGETGTTLAGLSRDPRAGEPTLLALTYLGELFGRRGGQGVAMAQRALRLAVPEAQVAALCVSFTDRLLAIARPEKRGRPAGDVHESSWIPPT